MIWILFLGTFVTSLLAAARVKSNYLRFARVAASSGLTGAEAALEILRHANIDDVDVIPHDGLLADHYDPLHKRLVLSTDNYFGRSVAALGVAAHEAGHAIQHAQAYLPLQLRMAAVGLTTFASQVVMWLPLFGMVTGLLSNRSDNVAHLSCEIFSRFPTAVESPCCHRKPSKSEFFNELKTPSSQHPSVAQIFHSWKRVVFQIPPDWLASERLSVGIETKFAQGRK